ncbi:MAG: WD40 repeat domain-containing protein, partial [Rivularia sp. (in: cyanobacteria)]
ASLNKRFVTVLHQQVLSSDLPPELAKVQWIDFNSNKQDFNANFNQLLRTIETDRQHVHSHSKWLQRDLEWEYKDKNDDLLLRGSNLIIAQNWLEETEEKKKKPAITVLQKEFIQASQNAVERAEEVEKRRQERMLVLQEEKRKEAEARKAEQKIAKLQKYFIVAVSIAFLAAVGFGAIAIRKMMQAETAQMAQFNSLIRFSLMLSQQNLKFDAIIEAIRAGEPIQEGLRSNQKTRSSVLTALQAAVYEDGFREQNRLKHQGTVFDVAWSRDGKQIVSASENGTIKLWNLNGKEIRTIKLGDNIEARKISFSPDGKTVAFVEDENTFKISNLQEKQPEILEKHDSFWNVVWSPDGKTIASLGEDKIKLWDTQGNLLQTLTADQEKFTSVSFSPDGKTIASSGYDDDIKLWNVNNGQVIKTMPVGKNTYISSSSFSPDGKAIAFTSDNHVKLWNIEKEETLTLAKHDDYVLNVAWSPDGNTIASASKDNTVKIWDKKGTLLQTLKGHNNSINTVKFSPDGKKIATASDDNTVRLWSLSENKLTKLKEDNETELSSVAWNPKENTVVVT